MTCRCCMHSPFRFAEFPRPSIFARDSAFTYGASTGQTMGQIASRSVTAFEEKTGRSLGTIGGINDRSDRETAERNDTRRLVRQAKRA